MTDSVPEPKLFFRHFSSPEAEFNPLLMFRRLSLGLEVRRLTNIRPHFFVFHFHIRNESILHHGDGDGDGSDGDGNDDGYKDDDKDDDKDDADADDNDQLRILILNLI